MTSVTESGSESQSGKISRSSCLKCEKLISLVDQLTKNMHEFEVVTMEMEFDLKSAKSKSDKVLSNFWQLISMIKSIKITGEKEEAGRDLCENPNPNPTEANLIVTVENHGFGNENENQLVQSKTVEKMRRNSNLRLKVTPNPNVTETRRIEIQRANRLLRTIKCETPEGFYNLFQCVKCQLQFNRIANALRHVQVQHLCLGTPCPTCRGPFFDKKSLELHIPKCYKNKQTQFGQIKVWLKNDRKKPVKVQLQPHKKQQQKEREGKNSTRNRSSGRKIRNQDAEKKNQSPVFDLSRLKVRNPFENFSIVKAMNVKVVIQRLGMEKKGKISSKSQPQVETIGKIDEENGKERNSSQEAENESAVPVLSCEI